MESIIQTVNQLSVVCNSGIEYSCLVLLPKFAAATIRMRSKAISCEPFYLPISFTARRPRPRKLSLYRVNVSGFERKHSLGGMVIVVGQRPIIILQQGRGDDREIWLRGSRARFSAKKRGKTLSNRIIRSGTKVPPPI